MVAFETLLLGVVFGWGPIRLMVAPPVASVEVRLDGATLAVLHGPPWSCEHDFGASPMPHELSAIGFDASGRRVGQVTQWVNFGHRKAGVSVLLERGPGPGNPRVASVAWNALDQAAPEAVTATLDGAPLPITDPHRIQLPSAEPSQTHLLSVEVEFPGDLRERADVAFGGDVIDRAESELTAIAVNLPPKQKSFTVRDARGLFLLNQEPVEPLAIERSRAEVAIVADRAAETWLQRLMCFGGPWSRPRKLREDRDRFYVVGTVPRRIRGPLGMATLFPTSPPTSLSWLNEYCAIDAFTFPEAALQDETIAIAMAAAGARVAAYNHRRALVLLLGDTRPPRGGGDQGSADVGTLDIGPLGAYLTALDVPLFVWALSGPKAGLLTSLGPAEDVSTPRKLRAAVKKLKANLDLQWIVWFSGRHLPQRITLNSNATGVTLAGNPAAGGADPAHINPR